MQALLDRARSGRGPRLEAKQRELLTARVGRVKLEDKAVLTAATVTTVVAVVVEAVVAVAIVVADEVEIAPSTKMRLPNNNRTYPVLSANIIRI